jgi:hypothetical protein
VELARHYFRWNGSASLAEFQWFSGLGAKAAKAVLELLKLDLLQLEPLEDRLMLSGDREAFKKFKASKTAAVCAAEESGRAWPVTP